MKVKQVIIVDLKKLAAKKGLTLKALARLSGIDYFYLCRCSNGKHILSDKKWDELKKYL